MEGDPKPGALMGRMSFRRVRCCACAHASPNARRDVRSDASHTLRAARSFNVETEKLHASAEAELARRSAASGAWRRRSPAARTHVCADAARDRAGASAGASVSDAQMAQRLGAGKGKGAKQPAAHAATDEQPAKRAKGDARRVAGGAAGGAAAAGGFQKPAAYDGGRFFSQKTPGDGGGV